MVVISIRFFYNISCHRKGGDAGSAAMRISLRGVVNFFVSAYHFLLEDIWRLDFRRLSPIKAFLVKHIRILLLVGKKFSRDRLAIRASALVYATLLAVVPLLAVMFALLKGFGVHNALQPFLEKLLAPLGEQAVRIIVPTVVDFVRNANVAALGAVGFLTFLLSSISIVNNMERSFNDVWRVKKTRGPLRRSLDYLGVLVFAPVLTFVTLGITASLQNVSLVKTLSEIPVVEILANWAAPVVAAWIVFLFMFVFIPNTRVRFCSALYGAVAAGTLWQLMNFFFARVIVSSYQSGAKAALYASFAVVPLFLLWLYLSWTMVLLGTELSYVHQNLPGIAWRERFKSVSPRLQERLDLRCLLQICWRFVRDEPPPTVSNLVQKLRIPRTVVETSLSHLMDLDLIHPVQGRRVSYTPAKSPDTMQVADIFRSLRTMGGEDITSDTRDPLDLIVTDLQNDAERARMKSFKKTTIGDLLKRIEKVR
jgi:membrane protein